MMVKSVADAITNAVKGDVLFMDPTDFNTYNFMAWVEAGYSRFPDGTVNYGNCLLGPEDKTVEGVRFCFRAPEIVIHTDYNDVPDMELKWGRKNLGIRDNHECQYCGTKVYGDEATIDHITPKSRGGKNTWTNTCIACFKCNTKKRDLTPSEAGMVLRTKPVKPHSYPLTAHLAGKYPSSWARWLPAHAVAYTA